MNLHDSHPVGQVPENRTIIERLAARLGISQPEAEQVAGAVLGPLEQHLDPLEAEALEAELPIALRRAIHRVEKGPSGGRHDTSHPAAPEELYRRVAGRLRCGLDEAHPCILAVFETVRSELSEGVRNRISARLSPELRALWLGNM